jgi:hypothetical protein
MGYTCCHKICTKDAPKFIRVYEREGVNAISWLLFKRLLSLLLLLRLLRLDGGLLRVHNLARVPRREGDAHVRSADLGVVVANERERGLGNAGHAHVGHAAIEREELHSGLHAVGVDKELAEVGLHVAVREVGNVEHGARCVHVLRVANVATAVTVRRRCGVVLRQLGALFALARDQNCAHAQAR